MLGVTPAAGRVFTAEEEKRGERVVVLSHAFWQRQFAGSPHALGADLVMDGRKSRIIGVMPPRFQFPFHDTQVWEPLTAHPYWAARDRDSPRSANNWFVLARIKPNLAWPQAQAEMDAIARRIRSEYPNSNAPTGIRIVPLYTQTTGKVQLSLSVLFAAVFLMLLIACINVANLLLARGSAREREFAVRRALGAGRMRVAGQLLAESFVLSATGGLLGLLLAAAGLKALIAFAPQDIPRLAEARIDPQVLVFTVAISVLSAILAGLWPAGHNSTRLAGSRQWTTVASRRLRSLLVAGEFSLALVLVTAAGLLVHSFLRLRTVDPGFRPGNLLVMHINLHVGKTRAQQVAYFREAIERAQTIPGVRSAAAIGHFLQSYEAEPVAIDGRPPAPSLQAAGVMVSGPYFQTAGISLKRGRFFTDLDRPDSLPVAIVNEKMARSFWPGEDPIGKKFSFPDRKSEVWIAVVGVVGDMHRQGIEKDVAPQVFRPHAQDPDNEMDLLVRTASDPLAMAESVRAEIQSIDKTVPKFGVTTVERQLQQQTAVRRFDATLIGLFSIIALSLSAIGIYGLMHFVVVQRGNEIGVRMALGARYGDVLLMVLRQGLRLAGVGVLVGVAATLGVTRLLSRLLYGVTPTDPLTFAVAPVILLAVAALACWLPARRAARIDPVLALRQD
jgi:putative ABC transport system permease protein